MTTTLAADGNNDLFVGPGGSLAVASGINAVLQVCANAAKTLRGEMIYAVDQGIPYFTVVWNGTPNRVQFEAFLRRALLAVAGVEDVVALTSRVSGGVLSYDVTVKTSFGIGSFNG